MSVHELLNERETVYGDFSVLAHNIQIRKELNRQAPSWKQMTAVQREVMDMNVVKDCRILYGSPKHRDNWIDKCGYAQLAVEEFDKAEAQQTKLEPMLECLDEVVPPPMFLAKDRP